jgi:hypothetical protein
MVLFGFGFRGRSFANALNGALVVAEGQGLLKAGAVEASNGTATA